MGFTAMLIAAVLPAIILLIYIYNKDKVQPEPTKWLVKGFLFGVISAFASTLISSPLGWLGFYTTGEAATFREAVRVAFFGAAIPEEAAKLLMLWLLLRKNPYFDEKIDGVVYAACVGMGFAAIENVMYLSTYYSTWVTVGLTRALISVPGHFMFAIAMGYYYSLGYWGKNRRQMCMAFVAPMVLHGIFDALLMMSDLTVSWIATGLMLCFFYFFFKLRRLTSDKINDLLADNETYQGLFIRPRDSDSQGEGDIDEQ